MSQEAVKVPIKILGITYQISCEPGEREALIESANLLDERLTKMREGSRLSLEQASMMVALNFAGDYLKAKREAEKDTLQLEQKLRNLMYKVDEQLKN